MPAITHESIRNLMGTGSGTATTSTSPITALKKTHQTLESLTKLRAKDDKSTLKLLREQTKLLKKLSVGGGIVSSAGDMLDDALFGTMIWKYLKGSFVGRSVKGVGSFLGRGARLIKNFMFGNVLKPLGRIFGKGLPLSKLRIPKLSAVTGLFGKGFSKLLTSLKGMVGGVGLGKAGGIAAKVGGGIIRGFSKAVWIISAVMAIWDFGTGWGEAKEKLGKDDLAAHFSTGWASAIDGFTLGASSYISGLFGTDTAHVIDSTYGEVWRLYANSAYTAGAWLGDHFKEAGSWLANKHKDLMDKMWSGDISGMAKELISLPKDSMFAMINGVLGTNIDFDKEIGEAITTVKDFVKGFFKDMVGWFTGDAPAPRNVGPRNGRSGSSDMIEHKTENKGVLKQMANSAVLASGAQYPTQNTSQSVVEGALDDRLTKDIVEIIKTSQMKFTHEQAAELNKKTNKGMFASVWNWVSGGSADATGTGAGGGGGGGGWGDSSSGGGGRFGSPSSNVEDRRGPKTLSGSDAPVLGGGIFDTTQMTDEQISTMKQAGVLSSGPQGGFFGPRAEFSGQIPEINTTAGQLRKDASGKYKVTGANQKAAFLTQTLMNENGLTEAQAKGFVAGMMGESGKKLNPASYNPNDNGSPSGGMAQWHEERLANLRKFAKDNGYALDGNGLPNFEGQAKFLSHELNTTEKDALNRIKGTTTSEDATAAQVRFFERPADPVGESEKRKANLVHLADLKVEKVDQGAIKGITKDTPDGQLMPGKAPSVNWNAPIQTPNTLMSAEGQAQVPANLQEAYRTAPKQLTPGDISFLRNPTGADLKHVNPKLLALDNEAARLFMAEHPDYSMQIYGPHSGFRTSGSTGNHGVQSDGMGGAIDIQIFKKTKDGKMIPLDNIGAGAGGNAGIYQNYYNHMKLAQEKYYPDMKMRYGGYFATGSTAFDLMHNDVRGHKPMGGGSWEQGYSAAQMQRFGVRPSDNVGMQAFRQTHSYNVPEDPTAVASSDTQTVTEPTNGPDSQQPVEPMQAGGATPTQAQPSQPSAPTPQSAPVKTATETTDTDISSIPTAPPYVDHVHGGWNVL